jgi:large subunit ribosomal protein L29
VKAKELRDLTSDELNQRMQDLMESLMTFRIQVSTGVVDNMRSARNARRDIARIKTILRERELKSVKAS